MNKTKWVLVEIAQKHNFLPLTQSDTSILQTIEQSKRTGQSTEVVMAHPVKICIKD
jgi:hypothetical protein